MKFLAMLIVMGLGIFILARLFGIDLQHLDLEAIKQIIERVYFTTKDLLSELFRQIKQSLQDIRST